MYQWHVGAASGWANIFLALLLTSHMLLLGCPKELVFCEQALYYFMCNLSCLFFPCHNYILCLAIWILSHVFYFFTFTAMLRVQCDSNQCFGENRCFLLSVILFCNSSSSSLIGSHCVIRGVGIIINHVVSNHFVREEIKSFLWLLRLFCFRESLHVVCDWSKELWDFLILRLCSLSISQTVQWICLVGAHPLGGHWSQFVHMYSIRC